MLSHLSIHNFAIVENLELELNRGMTVVSGETGAGKSIMIDALQLALGGRADSGAVRNGANKAEIIANFDISNLPRAQAWLDAQELSLDGECILRRIITCEGRSRSFINGRNIPLSSLKDLAQHLVAIHGQHEHQGLLHKEHHRVLLDNFANHSRLQGETTLSYKAFKRLDNALIQLTTQSTEQQAKVQLLSYQVEELDQLALKEDEVSELETEQVELSQASEILNSGQQLINTLDEGDNSHVQQLLNQCVQLHSQMPQTNTAILQAGELLNSALIQVEEAASEVRQYLNKVDLNPQRLFEVEERLSTIYELARKHKVEPYQLLVLHQTLEKELNAINGSDETIAALTEEVEHAKQRFMKLASKLSKQRHKFGKSLSQQINIQLASLGMPDARFSVQLTAYENQFSANGLEEVEFIISTNKGQPAKALAKIASGGELSRISLAIQVVTAQSNPTATLMFDEVDVGIGGAIAEVVGKLLRELGEKSQIMCITHQPQVASQGHQHLYVSKKSTKNSTQTHVVNIDNQQRINEIARMLGGVDITQRSLDHAREMLQV